ncbi:hypothetical protein KIH39_12655 [Telmatocola sphagniphila]|uniref:DUF4175 family protein n=1 Tax=Telmatocola sphagniphila TaxID=1123043 RepID=A0A8E6F0E5_9BACT|nr:hypothetical protein [Telmatocola sphagniphila]QVL34718.1 hypothetical protein KIH39_12655 [Telmatocola sphagniphila]
MNHAVTDHDKLAPEIQQPLARLRDAIRRYLTIDALLSVAIFVCFYFWISLFLDYGAFLLFGLDWVQDAPHSLRSVVLALLLAALAVYVIRCWLLPVTRSLKDRALAIILEDKFPKQLDGRLITAVELVDIEKQSRYGYSAELIRKTVNDVKGELEKLPIDQVLNHKRLQAKRRVLLATSFLVFFALSIFALILYRPSLSRYFINSYDVSSILVERNILLKDVPWPRSTHLEIIDFPGNEMRIGRDSPAPRLRVAAYKWVIADTKSVDGWRPMTWADLPKFFDPKDIPEIPVQAMRASREAAEIGSFVFSPVAYSLQVPLPTELADIPSDLGRWKIDRVEQLFLDNEETRQYLRKLVSPNDLQKLESLFTQLQAKVDDYSNSRKLRKLHIPSEVNLDYRGLKSSVEMGLKKESATEFSGTLSDLKESVDFHVRADDYVSPARRITLVPPPSIVEFTRTEYRPAYLYHTPPYDSTKPPLLVNYSLLKGLKQEVSDGVSLTGDRSKFDLPAGSEVVFKATVDKELSSAAIIPKPGKYPGVDIDAEPKPIPVPVGADGKTVTFGFQTSTKNLITRLTEFEIQFTDRDNVQSRRLVSITPIEDKAPEVDVVIDVIRKVGSQYMCTAKAIIPFSTDSKVTDDNGLAKVEFTYSYVEIESPIILGTRSTYVTPLFLSTPLIPSLGDVIQRATVLKATMPLIRSQVQSSSEINEMVPAFVEEYNQWAKKLTLENLKLAIKQPLPPQNQLPIVNSFKFKSADETSYFDLRKYAKSLEEKDERVAQRSYTLTLNISATDTNVESGPKVSLNKEPFLFKLVSEGELLAEISREEAGLALKLDEVIRRLEDLLAKYSGVASRLNTLKEKDDFLPDQTRLGELLETLAKTKDTATDVSTAYTRIIKEYRFNRFNDNLIGKLDEKIVKPLDSCVKADFPAAEEALNAFAGELGNFQLPQAAQVQITRDRLEAVLFKLKRVREEMGGITGIQQVIIALQKILEAQDKDIRRRLDRILENRQSQLYDLTLVVPPPVTIEAGGKQNVKLGVILGTLFRDDPSFKVEVPVGSDLKVPPMVKFSDEATDVSVEITAGKVKGEFTVQLIPIKGPIAFLKVIVK